MKNKITYLPIFIAILIAGSSLFTDYSYIDMGKTTISSSVGLDSDQTEQEEDSEDRGQLYLSRYIDWTVSAPQLQLNPVLPLISVFRYEIEVSCSFVKKVEFSSMLIYFELLFQQFMAPNAP